MAARIIAMMIAGIFLLGACGNENSGKIIYNGRVDTDIIRINAKISGEVDSLFADDGLQVKKGQVLAKIDNRRLVLQEQQQTAQLNELEISLKALDAQIKQVRSQLDFTSETLQKTEKMVSEGAATEQKRDELSTQKEVLEAQIESHSLNRKSMAAKREQLKAAIEITKLNIIDATIIAPVDGVIINRFVNYSELAAQGMLLFEMADLIAMEATVYVSLEDLPGIRLQQEAAILVDGLDKKLPGRVKWISDKSEFTPKTILTPETRTTLVYAVKIDVNNEDGVLKIGMPVDVEFQE